MSSYLILTYPWIHDVRVILMNPMHLSNPQIFFVLLGSIAGVLPWSRGNIKG